MSRTKTQRIQCGSNLGHLDYESNTLPQSHDGVLVTGICHKEAEVQCKTSPDIRRTFSGIMSFEVYIHVFSYNRDKT